jgi:hypothetical protein
MYISPFPSFFLLSFSFSLHSIGVFVNGMHTGAIEPRASRRVTRKTCLHALQRRVFATIINDVLSTLKKERLFY